jgi:hypothetical protein
MPTAATLQSKLRVVTCTCPSTTPAYRPPASCGWTHRSLFLEERRWYIAKVPILRSFLLDAFSFVNGGDCVMVWLQGCAIEKKVNCIQSANCCCWSDPPCGASCRLLIFSWCVLVCLTSGGRGAVASFGGLGPIYKLQVCKYLIKPLYPHSGFLHDLHNYTISI